MTDRQIDRLTNCQPYLRITQWGCTEMGMQPFPAQGELSCIGIHGNLATYKCAAPSLSTCRLNPAKEGKQHGWSLGSWTKLPLFIVTSSVCLVWFPSRLWPPAGSNLRRKLPGSSHFWSFLYTQQDFAASRRVQPSLLHTVSNLCSPGGTTDTPGQTDETEVHFDTTK